MNKLAETGEIVSITKLNNSEYQLRIFKVQMILRRDGVWDNANLRKPAAGKLPADWGQREIKAMTIIGLAVEDKQIIQFLTLTLACEMWLRLQSIHERRWM
jgi:hypothetical protein